MSHLYAVGFHGVGGAVVEVAYVGLVEVGDALFGGHCVYGLSDSVLFYACLRLRLRLWALLWYIPSASSCFLGRWLCNE